MIRTRVDHGSATPELEGETIGEVQTSYDTATGQLSVRVQIGELALGVILDQRATRQYLNANAMLHDML